MKLLCLDSNSILNRAFYGIKLLTTKDGTYTNAIFGFMNILQKLLGDVQPDCVMFAFDLKAPTFRHKMFDGYKAQRKGMPEELAQQLPIIKELLTAMGYRIVTKEGYEADDILGTYSALCEKEGHDCYIATGDRDSLQLIGEHTTVLLASSKMGKTETIFCNADWFREKYGTEPIHLIDIKALMGDSSDNIPGVAGIGEKTALKLVGQYGSLDSIYEQIDTIDVSKSIREKLIKGKESAYMSRTLATIDRSVPLDCTICDCTPTQMDQQAVFELLTRLEMNSLIKRLGITGEIPANDPTEEQKQMKVRTGLAAIREAIDSQDVCYFLYGKEKGDITSLALCMEDVVCFAEQGEVGFRDVLESFLSSEKPKVTFDCKFLFGYGFQKGLPIRGIQNDLMLSAYLLSAISTDYTIENLSIQYKITPPLVEMDGSFQQLHRGIVENCALLPTLSARLEEDIVENGQKELLHQVEIPLAQVLASMETLGFEIDANALVEYGKMLDKQIIDLQNLIYDFAGETFNINSPKQLGEILFDKLGLPAKKKTKTGYSTNAEVLEGLRGKHEIIESILEYRKVAKLKSTYVDGLLKVIGEDGRIHSHFNQTDTRTGRLSSTEPNLQNIPVRTELGSQLRKFFKAKDGCLLVDADYSQIELRVLAHIADDKNMIDAFQSGEDIHTKTASQVFHMPADFVTPDMRRKAKAVNFGIVYGIGAYSLSQDIDVSVAEADEYIQQYLKTFSGVKKYMDDTIAFAKEHGYVTTLLGRRRYVPEISASNRNIASFGERVAMNTPIQGTAADVIKIAMIKVYQRLEKENLKARLILQVHDELLVETPEEEAELVKNIVQEEMEGAMQLHVRLTADVNTGKTWYEAK